MCHRSSQAYGPLVQAFEDIPDSDFDFKACSGAILADLVATLPGATGQWAEGAQLNAIAPANQPSEDTRLVTLSIGGNDVGFPDVLSSCIKGVGTTFTNDAGCQSKINTEMAIGGTILRQGGTIVLDTRMNTYGLCDGLCVALYSKLYSKKGPRFRYQLVTVPSLAGLYEEIHQRAPQAEIRVLLYPHLFPDLPPAQCTVGALLGHVPYTIDKADMAAINTEGNELDAIIANAVTAAQGQGIDIKTVNAQPGFAGHEVCGTATPWLNGLILDGPFLSRQPYRESPYSFHPNALGQWEFATLFEESL